MRKLSIHMILLLIRCQVSITHPTSFQGTIKMVEKQMLPENTQLATDYESISAVNPPVKKATHFHAVSDLYKSPDLCTEVVPRAALPLHSSSSITVCIVFVSHMSNVITLITFQSFEVFWSYLLNSV